MEIIIILIVALGLIIAGFSAYIIRQERKHMYEKHHCNHCRTSFLHSKRDLALTHCPYCGNPLELHEEHPDYISWQDELQKEIPFDEYKK